MKPAFEYKESLSLDKLRNALIRQEETIIFSLIERGQFALNPIIYKSNPGEEFAVVDGTEPIQTSFMEYFLLETEKVHARVRRYASFARRNATRIRNAARMQAHALLATRTRNTTPPFHSQNQHHSACIRCSVHSQFLTIIHQSTKAHCCNTLCSHKVKKSYSYRPRHHARPPTHISLISFITKK